MFTQKLQAYYSFPLLTLTNKKQREKYSEILKKFQELKTITHKTSFMEKSHSLYVDLQTFIEENKKDLDTKQRVYFYSLENLTLQLKRFLSEKAANEFPSIFLNLEEETLVQGIISLSKEKKISKTIALLDRPFIFTFKISKPTRTK